MFQVKINKRYIDQLGKYTKDFNLKYDEEQPLLSNIYNRNLYKKILLSEQCISNLKQFKESLEQLGCTVIYNENKIQKIITKHSKQL